MDGFTKIPKFQSSLGTQGTGDRLSLFNEIGQLVGYVLKESLSVGTIGIDIDGHGKSISQGLKGYIIIPYDCVINNWYIISDKIGSIEIDVWKATNSIPTNLNSVTNSEKIKLQQEQINSNSTELWNNNIYTGDIIAFNVDNVVDINKVNVILKVSKI